MHEHGSRVKAGLVKLLVKSEVVFRKGDVSVKSGAAKQAAQSRRWRRGRQVETMTVF